MTDGTEVRIHSLGYNELITEILSHHRSEIHNKVTLPLKRALLNYILDKEGRREHDHVVIGHSEQKIVNDRFGLFWRFRFDRTLLL